MVCGDHAEWQCLAVSFFILSYIHPLLIFFSSCYVPEGSFIFFNSFCIVLHTTGHRWLLHLRKRTAILLLLLIIMMLPKRNIDDLGVRISSYLPNFVTDLLCGIGWFIFFVICWYKGLKRNRYFSIFWRIKIVW